MKISIIILFLLASTVSGFTQSITDLLENANDTYDAKNFRSSLYYLNKVIELDSISPEILKKRGNCYMELNQLDSALYDFNQTLALDSGYIDVLYNIGNIYELKGKLSTAAIYFNTFIQLSPNDVYGYLRLADIKNQQRKSDSATVLLEKAYSLDSNNLFVIGDLAWQYYETSKYDQSIQIANRGKSFDSLELNYFLIAGLSYMETMQYRKALSEFEITWAMQVDNYDFLLLKIEAQIMSNTNPDVIYKDSADIYRFKNIHAANLSDLDAWISDPNNQYYYQSLEEKFVNRNDSLSLDDYFMYYYGQTNEPDYSPYNTSDINLNKLANEGDYESIINRKDAIYSANPINPDEIFYLAMAYLETNNKPAFRIEIRNYHGFMKGLIASGSGTHFNSAYIVTSPHHEYTIINYLGSQSKSQSLINQDGHNYDVLETLDQEGNEMNLYFIIDKPFNALSKTLNKNRKKNKKKKK